MVDASTKALTRLKEEEINLKLYAAKIPPGCVIKPKPKGMTKDYLNWLATFTGRAGTPWENGKYTGTLKFTTDYPDVAPLFVFDPIDGKTLQHMNVFSSGAVCIDILKAAYTPDKSLLDIIIALDNLFYNPNPRSPANGTMSGLYVNNREEHDKVIREQAAKTKK